MVPSRQKLELLALLKAKVLAHIENGQKAPLLSYMGVVIMFVRPVYLVEIFQTLIKSLKLKRGNQ